MRLRPGRHRPSGPFMQVDLPFPDRRDGKVRTSYAIPGTEHRLLVTTDRLSVFDRVVAGVMYKGQVLNELSAWWFERLADTLARNGARHHLVSVPDPNVSVVRAAEPLPVEVIVRGCITGVTDTSLWRRYEAGQRVIDGHRLPDGLHKNEMLPNPIVTPTTKAAHGGHDEPISVAEVPARGLVDAELWDKVVHVALKLFEHGLAAGAAAGALLADTKYEFGVAADGTLLLIDEVHTPDSSRWWVATTYEDRVAAGIEPESLDKEVVRRAYADIGYRGDGEPPPLPDEVWRATTRRYVDAYQRIAGHQFRPGAYPVHERILNSLTEVGLL